jgi:hypothetical protein
MVLSPVLTPLRYRALPALLPPADVAIIFRTFEWWFKQCDESKLNSARGDAAKSATHR